MDQTLLILQRRNTVTPDQGGNTSSTDVVDFVLDILTTAGSPATALENQRPPNNPLANDEGRISTGKKTAVSVLDFHNDFVTKEGIGSEYRGDTDRMADLIPHIPRVLDCSRKQCHEVILVRFLGNKRYQHPNMQHRDAVLGKRPEGSLGALSPHPSVKPAPGERVCSASKHIFDAFLCDGFERYLVQRGVRASFSAGSVLRRVPGFHRPHRFPKGLLHHRRVPTVPRHCICPSGTLWPLWRDSMGPDSSLTTN